jgi:hypothetical protein
MRPASQISISAAGDVEQSNIVAAPAATSFKSVLVEMSALKQQQQKDSNSAKSDQASSSAVTVQTTTLDVAAEPTANQPAAKQELQPVGEAKRDATSPTPKVDVDAAPAVKQEAPETKQDAPAVKVETENKQESPKSVSPNTPASPTAAKKRVKVHLAPPTTTAPANTPAVAIPLVAQQPQPVRVQGVPKCPECGCTDFMIHTYKPDKCANCFHSHKGASKASAEPA